MSLVPLFVIGAENPNDGGPAKPIVMTTPTNGASGWTPSLRAATDGVRSLLEIYDWTGGAGTKPATGYLTEAGALSATKAGGYNFNRPKRLEIYQGISNASGIATLTFDPAFPAAPRVIPFVTGVYLGLPPQAEVVTSAAATATVRVKQGNILNSVLALLAGATVTAIVIEA